MTIFDSIRYPFPSNNWKDYPTDIICEWGAICYNGSRDGNDLIQEMRKYILNRDIDDNI